MTYQTATFRPNATLMHAIMQIFIYEVEPLRAISGFVPAVGMQTIAKDEISHHARNGGNAMGIKEEDGPLISESPFSFPLPS